MWDLSSQTRDQSPTPCIGRQSLRHWITKEVSLNLIVVIVIIVQSASHVQLSVTPWTVALQTSLSFIIFWSLLKLMSIESLMPSNHLILCHLFSSCPQSFPASESFPINRLFITGGQSTGASASRSVLPMNIQG